MLSREQKDPVYLRDKVSQKHSKEQFENAQKIEQEYSKFFTGACANWMRGSEAGSGADGVCVCVCCRDCPGWQPPLHLHSDHDDS